METNLAIADSRQLAAKKIGRRTVFGGRRARIDNPDAPARFERRSEVIKRP
jgi:hypothetical protein